MYLNLSEQLVVFLVAWLNVKSNRIHLHDLHQCAQHVGLDLTNHVISCSTCLDRFEGNLRYRRGTDASRRVQSFGTTFEWRIRFFLADVARVRFFARRGVLLWGSYR